MPILIDKVVSDIASTIAKLINPKKIILFGSYANGNQKPSSDLDILIIHTDQYIESHNRAKTLGMLWKAVSEYGVCSDLILASESEIEYWKTEKNHVIGTALSEGIVLYES